MFHNIQIFCLILIKTALCLIICTMRSSASEMDPVLRPGVVFLPQSKPLRIADDYWVVFTNYNLFSYESFLKKISLIFNGFDNLLKDLEEESKSMKINEIPLTELQKGKIMEEYNEKAEVQTESEISSGNNFISVCHLKKDASDMSKYLLFNKELMIKLQNYKFIINQEIQSLSMHSYSLSYPQNIMDELRIWVSDSECPQHSGQNYLEYIFGSYFGQHNSFDLKDLKGTVHHYEDLQATVVSNDTFLETMTMMNDLETCLTNLQNAEHSMINFADRLIAVTHGIDTLIHSGFNEKIHNELKDLLRVVTNSVHGRVTQATKRYKDFLRNELAKNLDFENSYFSIADLLDTAKVELHSCENSIIQSIVLYIPTPEQYPLFEVLSTPISIPEGYLKYKKLPAYLAQINDSVLLFDNFDWTNKCKSTGNYIICPDAPQAYYLDQIQCMWNVYNIANAAIDLPAQCETDVVQSYRPLFINILGKNKILYSLPRRTPFTIYCKDKTRSLLMLDGTGYVVLPHKCELMLGSIFTFSPNVWLSVYRNVSFYMKIPDVSVIRRKNELKNVLSNIEHQLQKVKNEHNNLRGYDPEDEIQYDFIYYFWTTSSIISSLLLLVRPVRIFWHHWHHHH
ncbi:unnamed protein product [Meganyctiphanes norvegica]|uniref:Envelope fusion protein n=1 Tax=Meganyctiphanes norvegica TaxID=48144 RepID=A0AAV2S833_MEGNR